MKTMRVRFLSFYSSVLFMAFLAGCVGMQNQPGLVAVLTVYGQTDFYAGVLEGVVYRSAPQVRIYTITHDVEPFNVAVGSYQRGSLVRLLPHYRLHEKSIYALYPSRRFLDAKVKTWVEFLKQEIPKVLDQHQAIVDDPAHWA